MTRGISRSWTFGSWNWVIRFVWRLKVEYIIDRLKLTAHSMCADRSVEQIPQISQEIFLDRVTQRAYSKSGSGRTFLQSWLRLAEKQITQSKVMHCWGPTLVMRSSGRLIMIYFLGPAIHPFMLNPWRDRKRNILRGMIGWRCINHQTGHGCLGWWERRGEPSQHGLDLVK